MALNKAQLKNDLRDLYDGTIGSASNEVDAREAFVSRLADIIDGYVKTIHVKYTNGLIAPIGGGPVTGTINHTIE